MAKTVPVKTLKKMLKKAGLKTTGRKAALTRRAKKAKLMKKGGREPVVPFKQYSDTFNLNRKACANPDGSITCKPCSSASQVIAISDKDSSPCK